MLMSKLKMKKNSQQQSKQILKKLIKLKKKPCEKVCNNNPKDRKTDKNNSPSKLSLKHKKSSIKSNSTQVLFKQKNTSIVSPQTNSNKEISKTQNKNQIKTWRSNANIENNDYNELQCQKLLKIDNNWIKNKCRGSLINDQIFNEYGYSNLSNVKMYGKKSLSSLSKKDNRFPDKQQIQRLLHKYSQHLNIPREKSSSNSRSKITSSKSKISSSRNKKIRTLSTIDKSQKNIQIVRKQKVSHNQINAIKKMNHATNSNWFEKKKIKTQANLPSHEKKHDKKAKSFKQKKSSSKTILPDYFCCLSINKVQSKIQMMKDKQPTNCKTQQHFPKMNKIEQRQDEQKIKDSLSQTQKFTNKIKFQQKLILTKLKQQKHKQNKQANKQIFNKQTKKTSLTSRLNIQRSTISLLRKKGQNKLKDKNQKRSRKLSKKQIKIN